MDGYQFELQPTYLQVKEGDTLRLVLYTTDFEITIRDNTDYHPDCRSWTVYYFSYLVKGMISDFQYGMTFPTKWSSWTATNINLVSNAIPIWAYDRSTRSFDKDTTP